MKLKYLFFLLLINSFCLAINDVVVTDLKIFVNGVEYIIQGMCYNPVPLGQKLMPSNGEGGGGLCSIYLNPWGSWISACFDSDYFDGTPAYPGRQPPGPQGGWFDSLWERDFPILKKLGVNTLRIYNVNPTTLTVTEEDYKQGIDGIKYPTGANHTAFMDYAEKFGFKVIFPLYGDQSALESDPEEEFNQYLINLINEVGNHPALLMYDFTNELPLYQNQNLLNLVNQKIAFIKNYQMQKWNRSIPVTAAVVDLPESYAYLAKNLNCDVFTSNAGYRGFGFTDLWTGDYNTPGWKNLSCEYNKPLFIGEMGWWSINGSINEEYPNWFNQKWKALLENVDNGCIGGAFFEYNNEPLKAAVDQRYMGVVRFEPSIVNGISSIEPNAWNPDNVVPNAYIFENFYNGTVNGTPYNYNQDPFQLIGRRSMLLCEVTPEDKILADICRGPLNLSTKPNCTNPTFTNNPNNGDAPSDTSSVTTSSSSFSSSSFITSSFSSNTLLLSFNFFQLFFLFFLFPIL